MSIFLIRPILCKLCLLHVIKLYCTKTLLFITASKGQSNFRLIAYENEWNVVTATLIPPSPSGRGDIRSAMMVLRRLKLSQATRLLVVFCPTWAVSKLMQFAASNMIGMNMGNWTWIFSNLGNKKVKHSFCRVRVRSNYQNVCTGVQIQSLAEVRIGYYS